MEFNGADIQGINWQTLPFSRQKYRERRVVNYRNFHNLAAPPETLKEELSQVKADAKLFRFRYAKVLERCPIAHFQLRR